jgi:hypothetical protein
MNQIYGAVTFDGIIVQSELSDFYETVAKPDHIYTRGHICKAFTDNELNLFFRVS